jgi:mono/diheme cytochrome c family protein
VTLGAQAWLIVSTTAPAMAADPQRGEPMPHVGALTRKGYTDRLEDSYLMAIVAEGGEAFGKSAYMPSFKTTLSSQDIADVIAYVRTFPLY